MSESVLEIARNEFLSDPNNKTAGAYMAALMEAENEGETDDDEWLDGLAMIRDYLL